jgi:phosphoribosylformylglycinamidine (FGAM) synthase-like amidotransferase family enzyme
MYLSALRILGVGRNKEIMNVIHRLLNTPEGRECKVVLSCEEAITEIKAVRYHMVLLCGGISAGEEEDLRTQLLAIDSSLIIIRHYGGGSGLLENEIMHALAERLNR